MIRRIARMLAARHLRKAPRLTASDAGRNLAALGRLNEQERYRATARAMWAQQRPGEPLPACLEPRG